MNTHARIENRTPHDPLVLFGVDGGSVSLPRTGEPVRLTEQWSVVLTLAIAGVDIAVVDQSYGEVGLLPPPAVDVWHVVSQLVVNALPGRTDLLFPVDLVRDDHGTVVGCRALARFAPGQA